MTIFQRKVLAAVADNEYTGSIEVSLQLYGYPTALEQHNVYRAMVALDAKGFIVLGDPSVTDKGRKVLDANRNSN